MTATVLVVEDEPQIQELVAVNLEHIGHKVLRAASAEEAEAAIRQALPDVLVLDWMLPGESGLAFARLDCDTAAEVIRDDAGIDTEFRSILRQLITYMMEDPRTISTALEIVWIAKAIERIGDHAKNMAEYVIYIVKGTDVRHTGQIRGAEKTA